MLRPAGTLRAALAKILNDEVTLRKQRIESGQGPLP